MITAKKPSKAAAERKALWRRVKGMYDSFNREMWEACFCCIDPKLTEQSEIHFAPYREQMVAFKAAYGTIRVWERRISLHLDASTNKHDPRPFAHVYVIWQDDAHGFHMFKERWVRHEGKWYTRVVGLVPNKQSGIR